ncbi:MAG: PVC-type heme-binding CxxCH protein [Verrucomicrobiota bacterium]
MIRFFRLSGVCGATLIFSLLGNAAEFRFPNQTIRVPDGFEVQMVAGPPLVDRPITADFDEAGRLYVTDSSGTNDKVEKQLAEKPHRVLRLEDIDGDGRFDKTQIFADKMMFPEGCLWYRGSLYVSAPPSIWKLTDTDGDGVADKREEWLPAQTLTGCANDLHGPQLGPDGWIYWCKGAFAKQTYERPGQAPFVTRAAHIFRAKLDGSGIESVMTGGMDNPVSVAFTTGGERFLTGTFFVHPGGGQRDGIIHAIYGGVYGKDHDVLNDHKRTGDLMPIMTHHGPSASCYLLRYTSARFGPEYRDNIFACLFNLRKITRHVLVPNGATFDTKDEDFLTSDNPDFHPTALVEDADGSVLVIDTGGWYKICCPTSQLWKPDVLGAIYRVRRTNSQPLQDPRGARLAWQGLSPQALAGLLGDPRPAVRTRAMDHLAQQGEPAVAAIAACLSSSADPDVRLNAVWTLTRMDGSQARTSVRAALKDESQPVRQAALHSISVRRDQAALGELIRLVEESNPPVQRIAAEALGRLGDAQAVPALLRASGHKNDRILEHSLTYALIEIRDAAGLRTALAQKDLPPPARRAGLIALDQMDGGGVPLDWITPLITSPEPTLKETASWILGLHPEWASQLAGFFRERLKEQALAAVDRAELVRLLSRFARDRGIQQLLGQVAGDSSLPDASRAAALQAMTRSNLKEAPAEWGEVLANLITDANGALPAAAVSTTRALAWGKQPPARLKETLRTVSEDINRPAAMRLEALAALPGGLEQPDASALKFLAENVDPAKPVLIRSTAAGVLAKARMNPDQLLGLTAVLKTAGPLELPRLLGAFERSTDEAVGTQLLAALKESPGLAALRLDQLRPLLTNFPGNVQAEGERLLPSVSPMVSSKRRTWIICWPNCTVAMRRGQVVFNSRKGRLLHLPRNRLLGRQCRDRT